ncbi:MAG: TIGR04211 family SH3 domain-containing protein [Methylococcales bacterium]
MKKLLSVFLILLLNIDFSEAETIYVADDVNLTLRGSPSIHGKALKLLPIGTPLMVIENESKFDFIKVRLLDGTEGHIKLRFTTKQAPVIDPKDTASKTIEQLQSNNTRLTTEINTLKDKLTPGSSLEKSLATERDQLSRELEDLKKTAANSFQLRNERDELQERVVNVERELQQFKLENQALKDTASQDWFLYGGILSLIGVLLGFILPKLGWRRKNSWNSF